jgi:KDO2-lipid IV(A) lauroyltransferase
VRNLKYHETESKYKKIFQVLMSHKKISGKTSFYLVKSILFLTRIFPLKMSYSLCTFIVFSGSWFNFKRKRIALDNIKIVFPEKTEKERDYIFRESLRRILKSFFEFAHIINGKYAAEKILRMCDAAGLEYLDNLKSRNQGALLYSGHFGNFPLMIIWLALRGYPIAAIYKEGKNLPDDFFGNMLRKFNVTPLKYKSDSAVTIAIIKALKEGKIVLIQNDQSHPEGVYINFFNKYVPSPAGPALLAKRVGVPLIPAYICRDKLNHHYITILPEIPLQDEDDHEKFLKINTQIQLDWIADILIKHPTEWLWLHNRWKRAKTSDATGTLFLSNE